MAATNLREPTTTRDKMDSSRGSLQDKEEGRTSPKRAATPDYNSKTPSSSKKKTNEPPHNTKEKTSDGVPNWVVEALADEPLAQPWKKWVVIDEDSKEPGEFVVNVGRAEKWWER